MKLIRLVPALLLLALATGCATILHGSRQNIRVETDPPGATATAGDQTITTPGVLKLSRREPNPEVIIEKDGYVSRRVFLTRKRSDATWANLAFVPTGFAVGAATFGSLPPDESSLTEALVGPKFYWGVIFGVAMPLAAFTIDQASGAAWRLDPPTIVLRLQPVTAPQTACD